MRPDRNNPGPISNVVLGVDPGLATTGWGIIRKNGATARLIAAGTIETSPTLPLPRRLLTLRERLGALIGLHRPGLLAIEQLFFTKFATSIAATAQARGVILLTAEERSLPIVELNPREVKLAMTGFGSASKVQMQKAVQRLLSLDDILQPDDAADAVAMALCHLHTRPGLKLSVDKKSRAEWEAELLRRATAGAGRTL